MAQNNPSPTPLTGRPVLTANTVTAIAAVIVYLARTRGIELTDGDQNAIITLLSGPAGEILVGVVWGAMTLLAQSRVYSELSLKLMTGLERPPVEPLRDLPAA